MVINQSLAGVVVTALKSAKVGEIYGARHGIEGILREELVDLRGVPAAELELIAQTPSSALGSVRRKPTAADCEAIFEVLARRGVRWFFYIGGNDSAETVQIINAAARRAGNELVCFHIPKTIDNDLRSNDHTPGFGSAARFVACALMGDDLDNRALGGVKIDVIMGRHAGFLTAAAALGREERDDGPHLIYLPERPFDPKQFIGDVQAVLKRLGRCVVAVSEGIVDSEGEAIAAKFTTERDSHGNVQLSGTGALGDLLASWIRDEGGVGRVRADTFGYLQRTFPEMASEVDAREAREVGVAAVRAALSGKYEGGSIAIKRKDGDKYGVEYQVVALEQVARETRSMPAKFINKAGNNVTKAFIDYAMPLVGKLPVKRVLRSSKVLKF